MRVQRFVCLLLFLLATLVPPGRAPLQAREVFLDGPWVGVYESYPALIKMSFELGGSPADGVWRTEMRLEPLTGERADASGALGVFPVEIRFDAAAWALTVRPRRDTSMRVAGRAPELAGVLDGQNQVVGGVVLGARTDASPYFVLGRRDVAERGFLRKLEVTSKRSGPSRFPTFRNPFSRGPRAEVREWAERFLKEYPEIDPYRTEHGALFLKARNLFRDEFFKPAFHKTYDELGRFEMAGISASLQKVPPPRANYPEERANGVLRAVDRAFMNMVGTYTSRDITLSVLAARAISAWRTERMHRLDRATAGEGIWREIAATEAAERQVLALFWPSEREAFRTGILEVRTRVAEPLLARRTDELLARPATLQVARELASALEDTLFTLIKPAAAQPYKVRMQVRLASVLDEETRRDRIQLESLGNDPAALAAGSQWFDSITSKYSTLERQPAVRALLADVATRRAMAARARQPVEPTQTAAACGPVPPHLQKEQFGHVIYVLATDCGDTFTADEQLFIAGIIGNLVESCGFPSDLSARQMLITFRLSTGWVSTMGRQYGTGTLGHGIDSQLASAAAAIAGAQFASSLKCSNDARDLADEIVRYLRRTAGSAKAPGKFVRGCIEHYGGKATAEQCQCLADVMRAVFPDIHQQEFSRSTYRRLVPMNPFLAGQVMIQCRITEY